jgi:transposase
MAMCSPFLVVLSVEERRVLTARARSERAPYRAVLRARIMLAAAEGTPNAVIGRALGICDDTVGKWRARFFAEGLAGLKDRPRPGRQRTFVKPPRRR